MAAAVSLHNEETLLRRHGNCWSSSKGCGRVFSRKQYGPLTPRRCNSARPSRLRTEAVLDPSQVMQTCVATVTSFATAAESVPLWGYFVYLMGAGIGIPLSEDALCIHAGAMVARGVGPPPVLLVPTIYAGVVLSDLLTYSIGLLLSKGFMQGIKNMIMRDEHLVDKALGMIQRWGVWIGAIQRFLIGFRGPLSLFCGFTGVDWRKFLIGSCCGALITLPIQLFIGYMMRGSPNPYLTALAMVGLPNAIGHVLPLLVGVLGANAWVRKQRQMDQATTNVTA